MSVPSGTAQTYQGVINREDLSDMVYMISPTDTPFLSGIGRTKASNTLHEWTTDVLATAAANAQIEGDDSATAKTIGTGTRVTNRTQISKGVVRLSGTQQVVNSAGNLYTMAKQMAKASSELKRDMEFGLTQNSTMASGSATVARQSRGLEGWIATSNSLGVSGVAPDPVNNTAATDGTARTLTEAMVKTELNASWTAGGDPDVIMCGGTVKQLFSGFNGGGTQMGNLDDKKLISAIDMYVSDFGTLKIVPNRFQRTRTLFILEMEKWAIAYLRPFQTEDLAKTGDSDRKHIICEYTLESRNEAANAAVRDLS